MKKILPFSQILFLNLLLFGSFISQAQTDPPENLYVTPIGMASWDSITSNDFQFYKVFLNGAFVADTDSIAYQYGSNGEELIAGESYLAEISALYNDGLSEKVGFEFVYLPCDSFPPHSGFDGYFDNNELYFMWDQVEEELDQIYMGTNFYFENELTDFIPALDTFYTFPDPGPGFYNYCFRRVYSYDNGIHSWEACEGENCILNAGYPPDCDPPQQFIAQSEYYYILLAWNTPDQIYTWLQYDDGVNVDGIGGLAEFWYAVKWTSEQLSDLNGAEIQSIKYFPKDSITNIQLMIWEGINTNNLIHQEEINTITYNEWNTLELNQTVTINTDTDLWVGFKIVSPAYAAGCGQFTGNQNSDLISLDGNTWERLADYGLNYSWNLAIYIEAGSNSTPPIGYNVYKEGVKINQELITENSFLDYDFEFNVPYCYFATAVYEDCEESDPSNESCTAVWDGLNELKNLFDIYPNPVQTNCNIKSDEPIISLKLFNQMGQLIFTEENIHKKEVQIDLTPYKNGIYFIEIQGNIKSQISKLIIKH